MPGTDPRKGADPLVLLGRELLERYLVEERLATGGMSVIFRGTDKRLQRPVCVKVFFGLDPTQQAYQTSYEHFVQEAFALSQLAHPNTLKIYDFGYLDEAPKAPFHVSELMDGGTLATLIRAEGAQSGVAALAILEPIAGALAEAHGRGIIHRDIKPNNILFGAAGKQRIVKLADFGIAKAYLDEQLRAIPNRAQDTHAASGKRLSLYSPGWAAPEQLRAEPVGPQADVFALGLVTAFVMTGKKVYAEQGDIDILASRAAGDAHIERMLLRMDLPARVADVVRRACRQEPRDRYATAEEFVAELRQAITEPQVQDSGIRTNKFERPNIEPAAAEQPSAAPEPLLVLATGAAEVLAGGRRVRMLPASHPDGQLDIGGEDGVLRSPARLRLTLLPDHERRVRLHVKGLNCFLVRPGGRPASALEVDGDCDLELVSHSRKPVDTLRFTFGAAGDKARLFHLGSVTLAVPYADAPQAVMLDFGPDRELAFFCRSRPAPPRGKK